MKNLDLMQQRRTEIQQRLQQAVADGNDDAFSQAFTDFTELIQEAVMDEAKGLVQAADSVVLNGRGVRQLTSEENKYYQQVIDAMKPAILAKHFRISMWYFQNCY